MYFEARLPPGSETPIVSNVGPFDQTVDVGVFIPLQELTDKLDKLRTELIAKPSGNPHSLPLYGRRNRTPREAWHAMFFARAYECYFRLDEMRVWIEPTQDSAHDAILQWTQGGLVQQLKVQLKELPSESLNADLTLQSLIEEKVKSMAGVTDVALAFFLGRNHPAMTIKIPDNELAGVWIFGLTGDGKAEFISLIGVDEKGEHSNIRPGALPI